MSGLGAHPTLPDFDRRQRELPEDKPRQSGSLSNYPYARAIRSLLEQGRILEAQRLFEHAKDLIQDQKLHKALAPPRVKTSSKRGVERSAEFRWLDLNSGRFRGRWVALLGESLIASADSLKELLVQLKTLAPEGKPLVHHVD